MNGAYRLRPWTEVVRPQPDVASGDLALGTYAANLAAVAMGTGAEQPVYRDPEAFFGATYFTPTMRGLLEDVFGVLDGGPGDRAVQLRTPFGGGKTHTLLSLFHLATSRAAASGTPELDDVPDPGPVRVAVLSGEFLDPQRGREVDGRHITTLWGELAYQLGGWEAYEELLVDGDEGVPPGGELLGRLLAGRPTLLLLDELLVYIAKAKGVRREDSTAERQAMLFLQNLTEAVNQQPRAVMVYSLQMSVGEAVGEEGLLESLEKIAGRIDIRREPVTGDEVLRVVQRRLFEETGTEEVRREVAEAYAELLREHTEATAETDDDRYEAKEAARTLETRIVESYPFHPELIDLMNERWGSLPSYQRTRGALQFLATVVHSLWATRGEREPQALIGPGDVDLSDETTRLNFFQQVGETDQYSSVAQADFIGPDAGTRKLDDRLGRESAALGRLRVGTRVATSIMLLSFGAKEGADRGALEREVVAASLVPGLDGNIVSAALADLRREALLYLHFAAGRYRFEPRPNLNKLIGGEQQRFSREEVLERVRGEFEGVLGRVSNAREVVVWPAGPDQIADEGGVFRVVYLAPDWTEAPQPLAELTTRHRDGGPRQNPNGLAFVEPHATSFDAARAAARTLCAVESLLASGSRHNFSHDQKKELNERANAARRDLQSAAAGAYERVSVPSGLADDGAPKFERVDLSTVLGAGRPLHERVHEALELHVFSSLTPARLKQMAGLENRDVAWCEELVAGVYRYFEFPKLWSPEPLRQAIADGVANGLFAYCSAVEAENGELELAQPELLRLRSRIDPGTVDLGPGCAVLSIAAAERLVPKPEEPSVPEGSAEGSGAEGPTEPGTVPSGGGGPGAREGRTRVRLEIRATEDDLHTLQRALSGLRDLVRPGSMTIECNVDAASANGPIDEMRFQNLVREPLEEDPDVRHREEWS